MMDIEIKEATLQKIEADGVIKVDNIPLPVIINVVQLAMSGLPNVTEIINEGNAPRHVLQASLDSIKRLLMLSANAALAAPDSPQRDVQGAAIADCVDRFKEISEYALSQIEPLH